MRSSLRLLLFVLSCGFVLHTSAACDDADDPAQDTTGGDLLDVPGDSEDDTTPQDTATTDSTDDAADTVDDTTVDTATDTTEDTAHVDECIEAECAANGMTCDPVTFMCVTTVSDNCDGQSSVGSPCDPALATPGNLACVPVFEGATDGVCRHYCDASTPCTEDGEVCVDDGEYCQPDACESWFTDDCAQGRCTPIATDVDVCLPEAAGNRIEYAPCSSPDQCAPGLLCLEGFCIDPDCSVTIDEAVCPGTDDVCVPLELDGAPLGIGECAPPCTPWATGGCDPGTWCRRLSIAQDGTFQGACVVDKGVADDGEPCAGDLQCDAGLVCSRGVCKEVCDPEASTGGAACADAAQGCVPIGEGTPFEQPIGLCLTPCEPFVDDCGDGQWCAPNLFTESSWCRPTAGQAQEADFCLFDRTPATTCADGLVCMETLDCRIVCDPTAAAGAPGDTCGAGTSCAVLGNSSGQQLFVGYCAPTCDYHGGRPCDDPVRTVCAMGEPFFQTFDLCLPPARELLEPDESCDDVGLYEYELCGDGGALCVPRPGDGALLCKDVCAASEGAFGLVGHPDCRDATQQCEPIFGTDADLGLCMSP